MLKSLPSIAVVTQPTRMQNLLKKQATKGAAMFALRKAHEDFSYQKRRAKLQNWVQGELDEAVSFAAYASEEQQYKEALSTLKTELELGFPLAFVDRRYIANFDFERCVAVVVVGQDGLMANAAKYVGQLPIIGVNPDPERYDGILLPHRLSDVRRVVQATLSNNYDHEDVTLAEVSLNDGQRLLAFNELFVGCKGHNSARYTIAVGDRAEVHSSSGVLISTGAGSTGWISSVFNMAQGIARWRGVRAPEPVQFDRSESKLLWAVREPFKSQHSQADIVGGVLEPGEEMTLESIMPENGIIFSDGIEDDFLHFNTGAIANVQAANQKVRLVKKVGR